MTVEELKAKITSGEVVKDELNRRATVSYIDKTNKEIHYLCTFTSGRQIVVTKELKEEN